MARMFRKLEREPGSSRRNPGRGDGLQWRSSAYIPPQKVDNGDLQEDEEASVTTNVKQEGTASAEEEDEYVPHRADRMVCLMDIAKPAKRKAKKDRFHIVSRPESVISLSDIGELESVMTDDWEALSELCEEEDTFSVIGEEESTEIAEGSGNGRQAEVWKEAQS